MGLYDHTPHGGYFTQQDIREIVRYAQDRYITIIPEIDMPGHMVAALTAYPELGCTGGPYEVWPVWGVSNDILCAGNPRVYDFLEDVFSEVMNLFPSRIIHVGGDEAHEGYDPEMGARPVKRAIQQHLLNELSKRLLSGQVTQERPIQVDEFGDGLVFRN